MRGAQGYRAPLARTHKARVATMSCLRYEVPLLLGPGAISSLQSSSYAYVAVLAVKGVRSTAEATQPPFTHLKRRQTAAVDDRQPR
jgi:hypothetical protein